MGKEGDAGARETRACGMMKNTEDKLIAAFGNRIRRGELLARFTTFKIGGPADLFYEASTADEMVSVVRQARDMSLPVTVIGGGSNILIADRGIRGLVVKNSTGRIALAGIRGTVREGSAKRHVYVEADSGVIMNKLVRFTIEAGLSGLEMQLGLPGTVGGAIYMNSKWTHPEGYVGDPVYQATILTGSNDVRVVPRSYFQFGYDSSVIQKTGDIVLTVVFKLRSADKGMLWETANGSIAYRRESQPQGVQSSGCIFRNIDKSRAIALSTPNLTTSAGFLLDHAGMKGARVGDAHVSDVHANFMINTGRARASDMVELIERARTAVKQKFGVVLQEEIVRMGEF